MKEETKEWLGLTKADALGCLALILIIIGYFFTNLITITVLFVIGLVLGIVGMLIGMKPKTEVSDFTNRWKKYSSLIFFAILVLMILLGYILQIFL